MTDSLGVTYPSDAAGDPGEAVARCMADLSADRPAAEVLARLRELEGRAAAPARLRARFLRARAIAANRLGFSGDALGDLTEARRLLEEDPDHRERAAIDLTIALVHNWRGDGREGALALLRSVAESAAADDRPAMALALMEAGRLEMEIGRPRQAEIFLSRALQIGGDVPALEKARAAVALAQALVAAGAIEKARLHLDAIELMLKEAPARLRFLADLELARIARLRGDLPGASAALSRAADLVPQDPAAFERAEIAHVESELALSGGDFAKAERLLDEVVSRYATDDLAGREVVARLLQAQAFDGVGRSDLADATLAAALRRALARGLNGHADEARARIAARGGAETAMLAIMPDARPDEEANRRFVRRRPLGAGGYGSVSRAYDLDLGLEVALKRIKLDEVYDIAARARLLDEVRTELAAARRIEHPGVARIHGLAIDADRDMLVIEELVEGPTLRSAMAGRMEPARAFDLLARLSFALAAVHEAGIVHRDLKPENVILRGGRSPVIVDFGIALLARTRRAPPKGGTQGYMAPEQARRGAVDARADLYALGVIAHELLLGHSPEPATTSLFAAIKEPCRRRRRRNQLLAAGLDPSVAELVAHLLSPVPWGRPRAAAEVGARFAGAASELRR